MKSAPRHEKWSRRSYIVLQSALSAMPRAYNRTMRETVYNAVGGEEEKHINLIGPRTRYFFRLIWFYFVRDVFTKQLRWAERRAAPREIAFPRRTIRKIKAMHFANMSSARSESRTWDGKMRR